jgi:hypothetical protein
MAKKSNPKPPKTITVVSDAPESATVPEGAPKVTKSEEIRRELEAFRAKSDKRPTANEVVESLNKRGISVKAGDVYQVFNKENKGVRAKKAKPKTVAPKTAEKQPTKTSSGSFTVEELKAANKFVKTIGDAARAVELMDAMFGG